MNDILWKCKLWLQEHNNNKSSNKIYTSIGKDLPKIDGASTFQLCSHIYSLFFLHFCKPKEELILNGWREWSSFKVIPTIQWFKRKQKQNYIEWFKRNKNKIILNCTLCSATITRILLKYTLWLQGYNNIIADNK